MASPATNHPTHPLVARFRAWCRRTQPAFWSGDELELAASDIGTSSADLRALAARDTHAADLLPCRLRLLGLDPAALATSDRALLRDMQRLCSGCRSKRRCRRELNGVFLRWAPYCPNDATIRTLVAEAAAARH